MKIIAHRANLNGPDKAFENSPSMILNAIDEGFDVEIDIWYVNNHFFLGHDLPEYLINNYFIEKIKNNAWFHCKNLEAIYQLKNNFEDINFFWHQSDDFTITSKGFIWTYPGKEITNNSILVLPEILENDFLKFKPYGVCTDFPKKLIEQRI